MKELLKKRLIILVLIAFSPCEENEIPDHYNFKIEYGNVYVDGCDEIMKITENYSTHELRYSVNEEVDGMQDLRQILKALLEEMREKI